MNPADLYMPIATLEAFLKGRPEFAGESTTMMQPRLVKVPFINDGGTLRPMKPNAEFRLPDDEVTQRKIVTIELEHRVYQKGPGEANRFWRWVFCGNIVLTTNA